MFNNKKLEARIADLEARMKKAEGEFDFHLEETNKVIQRVDKFDSQLSYWFIALGNYDKALDTLRSRVTQLENANKI